MPEGTGYDEISSMLTAEENAQEKERLAQKEKQAQEQFISKWAEKIKRARKHDDAARKNWADDRRVARNEPKPGDEQWMVHTNLIGAILEVLAAFLYAKNPDVSIRPSKSVNGEFLKEYRNVSETWEIIVSRLFHDANLKRVGKRWVRSAMTVGISWIKAAMQSTDRDPLMIKELNDLRANLARVQAKSAQLKDGEADDNDVLEEEIKANIIALEGQMERQVAQGLILDIMAPEDVLIAPDCGEVENYLNAPWAAFDLYKSKDEALIITGWEGEKAEKLKEANLYTQRPRKGEDGDDGGSATGTTWHPVGTEDEENQENPDGFYRFTEIWSLTDGVVYTMVDGVQGCWAREPYAPRTGKRFYPIFPLAFHYIDGERWPQSDVFQLKSLQEEYNRIRSNYATHRFRSIPGMIFNERQIEAEDIAKLTSSETAEWVGIKPISPNIDMNQIFAAKKYNPVDANLYNTQVIQTEMEKVSGAQDAMQSGVTVEKTATEAQIMESGRGARTGARLDTLEDCLTDLSEYVTQLMVQTMDQADAQRYAGPQAVWVDMSVEEAHNMFSIEVKAGSTGKPKALSDRESWPTLMPLLEQMIDRVGHARMMGQEWAAQPWVELIKETSKRLDDQLEVEKFLPEVPPEVVQTNMQANEPSEKEEAETRNEDADTLKKLSDALEKNPLFISPAARIVQELNGQGSPVEPEPPITPPTETLN